MNFQAETADKSGEPGCLSDAVSAFFCAGGEPRSGLARDPGSRLRSRDVPLDTCSDSETGSLSHRTGSVLCGLFTKNSLFNSSKGGRITGYVKNGSIII